MRLPRMTLRRLLVAIAAVALLLGAGIEAERQRRRSRYLRSAEAFARMAVENSDRATDHEDHASWTERADVRDWLRAEAAKERELAKHARGMEAWSRRAAARTWPSPPGPPPLR